MTQKKNQIKTRQSKQIAGALALASCGLFATSGHATELSKKADDWNIDAALMYYGEQDRVQAIEAIGTAQQAFGDDSVLD
ncbi:MAG: DUF3570 domain-containing protein, partial [Shewanella sp.]